MVARGECVDEIAIGQRVAIHVHHGCGRCRNCLNGAYTACENYGEADKGHRATGFTCDGGFAEYVVHNVSCVYPLPDNLSWEESVLISTAGTSVHGLDRAGGLVAGDTVVVIGPGPVGIMTAQTVRALGATTVIVVGTRQERLDLAAALGATDIVNSATHDPVEEVRRLTGGRGADMVIESSGDPATPNQGLDMLRRGGKMLILAFYKDPVSFNLGIRQPRGDLPRDIAGRGQTGGRPCAAPRRRRTDQRRTPRHPPVSAGGDPGRVRDAAESAGQTDESGVHPVIDHVIAFKAPDLDAEAGEGAVCETR